jgi:hypothetical protein
LLHLKDLIIQQQSQNIEEKYVEREEFNALIGELQVLNLETVCNEEG